MHCRRKWLQRSIFPQVWPSKHKNPLEGRTYLRQVRALFHEQSTMEVVKEPSRPASRAAAASPTLSGSGYNGQCTGSLCAL